MRFVEGVDFCEQVRLLRQRDKLWALGLDPKSISGIFDRDDLRDLAAVCMEHPAYHVVSFLRGSLVVNRLEPAGFMFFLAEGNKDPSLARCTDDTPAFYVPLTAKVRRQAFFPMIPGGEGRDNPKLFANALEHVWANAYHHLR